ncbi:uncharacterized protein LOC132556068 [Ylistrum balloti]|uniref:uncharacterized protein LOC132556068 n=1 Tax=Ylistrum balloti TaxID=509963 RepID=UPI002905A7B1|nr:uncharacterized protein LOC132556068 [Ylistrum balloti]
MATASNASEMVIITTNGTVLYLVGAQVEFTCMDNHYFLGGICTCTSSGTWTGESTPIGLMRSGGCVSDGDCVMVSSSVCTNGLCVCPNGTYFDSEHEACITDCLNLYETGRHSDGVYEIKPDGSTPVQVYCDMSNGGWTVFQKQALGDVEFVTASWSQMVNGLGSPVGDHWLGLSYIHMLTWTDSQIHFDLVLLNNSQIYFQYTNFRVGNSSTLFEMSVTEEYLSNAYSYADYAGFYAHNLMKFTTVDSDNDLFNMDHERILKVLLLLMVGIFEKGTCFECDKDATICETTLVIHHKLTMMHEIHRKVYPHKGKLYKYDVSNPDQSSDVPMSEVITADGWEQERLVTVVNSSLPGPPIIVYEGQRLKVNVINELQSDTVAIHWHGLPQHNSPWMDGVAFVSQCPILPGQSFTYDFVAEPKGTYWYHSHVGSQRTKGLNGALIIREKNPTLNLQEHVITVQGWNHDWDSDMDHQKMVYGVFENRTLLETSKSLDGTFFSRFKLTSALINGRGRYYTDMEADVHNNAPLEVFPVTHMNQYRFRVINVGGLYPFRVSVDNHYITLLASDGYDFQPEPAESFIISPGERYDFILNANQSIGNYWIRAESLESNNMHRALAILRYNTAVVSEPTSSKQPCTASSECIVVNCPFSFYPASAFTRCIRFDELKSTSNNDPAPSSEGQDGDFREHFLNFAFPGTTFTPGSVNGRKFILPQVSALTQPQEIETNCEKFDCGEERICECMYSLPIKHNDVVQFVFLNMGKGRGWAHPIHLHGYSFYVVKMGFATYNETTGQYISQNTDIDCRGAGNQDESFCNDATWSDPNWLGGNIPNIELAHATRKDTIIIPSGGYAVVRIKANNPGVWIMHCHIELHSTDGMAMLINNSFGIHPTPPTGFPDCRGFPSAYRENQGITEVTTTESDKDTMPRRNTEDDAYTMKTFWVTVTVLGLVMLLMIAYILHLRNEVKKLKAQSPTTQSAEALDVSVINPTFKN